MTRVRAILYGLGAGLAGFFLGLILLHLWTDHLALHELAKIEFDRQQHLQQAPPAPGK